MQKLNQLLFFLSLSLMFVACGDDDSGGSGDPLDDLIGTYNSTRYALVNCDDPLDNDEISDGMCGTDPCLVLSITAGGNYSVIVYFENPAETESGTISVTGNTLMVCEGGTDCQSFTYDLTGSTLTLEGVDDFCDIEIDFEKV